MVKVMSIFLHFCLASGCICAVLAEDACPSHDTSLGAAQKVSPQPFVDLSDAGTHFVQVLTRAAHANKTKGTTAVQPTLNATHHKVARLRNKTTGTLAERASANATGRGVSRSGRRHSANATQSPVTEVIPVDCASETRPLQVIKGETGFSFKALIIATGEYEMIYDIPFDRIEGGYVDMNACDINPQDNILYCVLRAAGESYAVRLDSERIEFVAILPASIWSAGSFAATGKMFVSTTGAEMIVTPPLQELQGYPDKDDTRLTSYRSYKAEKPKGFEHTSDTVVVKMDMKGGGEGFYLISLYGPKLEIAKMADYAAEKTWIKKVQPGRWDNIWGAGFNYG